MTLLNAPGRKLVIVFAFAFGFLLPIASARIPRKIKLPPPGKSERIEGRLRGMDDHKEFVFHGESGTKVKIELTGAGPLRGVVSFPTGHEGGPGGTILDRRLPDTGEYRLRISESAMGEAWQGKFTIEISVAF
jgi:hypothetical protein